MPAHIEQEDYLTRPHEQKQPANPVLAPTLALQTSPTLLPIPLTSVAYPVGGGVTPYSVTMESYAGESVSSSSIYSADNDAERNSGSYPFTTSGC